MTPLPNKIIHLLAGGVETMPPGVFSIFPGVAFVLLLQFFCVWIPFARGCRTKPLLWFYFLMATLVGCSLPIDRIPLSNHTIKLWLFLISLFLIFVLPRVIPRFLVESEGYQALTTKIMFWAIGSVIALNLVFSNHP
jgi:hypothetical protein